MGGLDAASNPGVMAGDMLPRKEDVSLRILHDVVEPRELPRKEHVAAPSLTQSMHDRRLVSPPGAAVVRLGRFSPDAMAMEYRSWDTLRIWAGHVVPWDHRLSDRLLC